MTRPDVAVAIFDNVSNTLAWQLCPDCPVRNWMSQMTLEQAFAPSDEQEQYALALGESQIIASAATAALIRNRIGCGGAEALEEPCNCCGNQTACAALSKADDFIESEVEEG